MKSKILLFSLICMTQMSLSAHNDHSCQLPIPNPLEGRIIELKDHCSQDYCIKIIFPSVDNRDLFWMLLQDSTVWQTNIQPVLLNYELLDVEPAIVIKTCKDIWCYIKAALAQEQATCITVIFASKAIFESFERCFKGMTNPNYYRNLNIDENKSCGKILESGCYKHCYYSKTSLNTAQSNFDTVLQTCGSKCMTKPVYIEKCKECFCV